MILVSSENTWKKVMLARQCLHANERVENEEFIARSFCNQISAFFSIKTGDLLYKKKQYGSDRSSFQSQNFGDDYITWQFRWLTVFSSSSLSHDSVFRQKIDNLNEIVIFINSYEWKSWMLLSAMSLSITFARNVRSANHFTMKCFQCIDSVVVTWIDDVWVL